jgi:hypothetical protein
MKLEDSYTAIRFASSKYTWQIQTVLQYLDMMIDEEDLEETIAIVNQYPDIPEAQLALTELYQEINQPLKFHTSLEKLRREYPSHIEVKATLARSKYHDFSREDHRSGFEALFAIEMDCLMLDKALPQVISDREMRILLISLAKYFTATGNKNGYYKIYSIADHCDQVEIRESVACEIKGQEPPMGGPSFEAQLTIEDWASENLEDISTETIKWQPNNDLFYTLLNKPADRLDAKEIATLSALHSKDDVEHDITWLLCQGLMRTYNTVGECSQDYFLHALFLTAHFELTKIAKILWQIWTGIPELISDRMIGDVGQDILGPAVQKLGLLSLDGFYEMLIFNETEAYDEDDEEPYLISDYDITNNFWYTKSMIFDALGAMAALDSPQQKDVLSLLHRLWDYYAEHDDEVLGWLGNSIVQYGIKGFEHHIAQAYKENKIDRFTHGTFEQFIVREKENNLFRYQPFKPFSNLNAYYEDLKRIEAQFAKGKKLSIENQINNTVKEVQRKAKKFEKEIQESLYGDDSFEDEDLDYSPRVLQEYGERASFSPDEPIKRPGPKVGRNDPCPCGSGKKYKKCCL